MKTQTIISLFAVLLASCAPVKTPVPNSTATDTPLSTATLTPEPTATFTPEPTATSVVSSIEGVLFFDMNANGLQDKASFVLLLDQEGKPPLIIQTLFPEIIGKNGKVFTVDEPSLSDFRVCWKDYCETTDSNGDFSIRDIPVASGTNVTLKITDPNAENAQLAMKFINQWLKDVIIPAYEINNVKVPEQHLNDTQITTISKGLSMTTGQPTQKIGLMQGWLTLPFTSTTPVNISILYDRDPSSAVLDYLGKTNRSSAQGYNRNNHYGVDFELSPNSFITAQVSGNISSEFRNEQNNARVMRIVSKQIKPFNGFFSSEGNLSQEYFYLLYGHHKFALIDIPEKYQSNVPHDNSGMKVYNGQIIALSGSTGTSHPHTHQSYCGDRYRCFDPFAQNNEPSMWTVYNTLVYPY